MAWPAPTCWRMPLTKARRLERSVDFLLDSSLRKLYPTVGKPSSS
uniref:Alternative protein MTFP1 n=1 Tax=Homo sapiens TaxID=9606 RepID=L0R6K6_HUMAN|nr:alternative protein MTFP1 [Homo sapiens]